MLDKMSFLGVWSAHFTDVEDGGISDYLICKRRVTFFFSKQVCHGNLSINDKVGIQ